MGDSSTSANQLTFNRHLMRPFLLSLVVLSLSACNIVYKLPTRQGNVIEQRDLDKLKPGMTREQVEFVMGTPLATTPFRSDRWDYYGYYESPQGQVAQRTVTMYFDGEELSRIEGADAPKDEDANSKPDVGAIMKADEQDRRAAERGARENDPGVIFNPDQRAPN
tara:strand:- start:1871 stop:2365 length:495 start_codon:yes stop_codon:yes gene_type:complete